MLLTNELREIHIGVDLVVVVCAPSTVGISKKKKKLQIYFINIRILRGSFGSNLVPVMKLAKLLNCDSGIYYYYFF